MEIFGYFITGGIIAGGSKGAIIIFKEWMGIMSSAEKARLAKDNVVVIVHAASSLPSH